MSRVPDAMAFSQSRIQMMAARAAAQEAQTVASSGMLHSRASDDPGWARALAENDSATTENTQLQDNINHGLDMVQAGNDSLNQAGAILARVQELAVQFGSDTYNATDRAAGAAELAQLRDSLLQIANSKNGDIYVFAGYQTGAPPFDSSGNYLGDNGDMRVDAGSGQSASMNVSGASVFTAQNGGVDVFGTLTQLATALSTNNAANVRGLIGSLQASAVQMTAAQQALGSRQGVLNTLASRLADQSNRLAQTRASTVEADPIKAYSELSQTSAALQGALQVSAQTMQQSLLKYL